MAKGPGKTTIYKSQGNVPPSELSYATTASLGYPNTTEAQENDLKSNLIKMMEVFKEERSKYETVHLFLPVLFHTIGFKDVQTHTTGNTHCIVT